MAPKGWLAAASLISILSGCGQAAGDHPLEPPRFGPDARYRPPPLSRAVARAAPVAALDCGRHPGPRLGVHLEVFVNGYDVVIPSGIGVAPPHRRDGAFVRGGRCSYALRTTDPTGMIEVRPGTRATLGQFFSVWGQRLGPRMLLSFNARGSQRVIAYSAGRRWSGDPRDLPLSPHSAIVVELGRHVVPHPRYAFPPDL